jgi:hypothetical protein
MEAIGNALPYDDRELTDGELIDVWQSTIAGVSDGSIPMFEDRDALIQAVMRRLGR